MAVRTLPVFSYPVERRAVITTVALSSAVAITFLVLGILAKVKVSGLQHLSSANTYLLLSLGSLLTLAIISGLRIPEAKATRTEASEGPPPSIAPSNYSKLEKLWKLISNFSRRASGYVAEELESRRLYLICKYERETASSTRTFFFSTMPPTKDIPSFVDHHEAIYPDLITIWDYLPYLEKNEYVEYPAGYILRTGDSIIFTRFSDTPREPASACTTILATLETLQSRKNSNTPSTLFQSVLRQNGLHN